MYLTQYTDYALRVLIYAAAHQPAMVNIAKIASDYQISKSHLMKVVTALVKGGFLCSIRGKNGGLYLARSPAEIGIGDVVRHMEPMQLVECMSANNRCRIAPGCRLAMILSGAGQAFLEHLDRFTLADLLTEDTLHILLQAARLSSSSAAL